LSEEVHAGRIAYQFRQAANDFIGHGGIEWSAAVIV
jgi:hypothetical protein